MRLYWFNNLPHSYKATIGQEGGVYRTRHSSLGTSEVRDKALKSEWRTHTGQLEADKNVGRPCQNKRHMGRSMGTLIVNVLCTFTMWQRHVHHMICMICMWESFNTCCRTTRQFYTMVSSPKRHHSSNTRAEICPAILSEVSKNLHASPVLFFL